MANFSLFYFFHILPLLVIVGLPLYLIVVPMKWGFDKIEDEIS